MSKRRFYKEVGELFLTEMARATDLEKKMVGIGRIDDLAGNPYNFSLQIERADLPSEDDFEIHGGFCECEDESEDEDEELDIELLPENFERIVHPSEYQNMLVDKINQIIRYVNCLNR